eukprot:TRINITY_DN26820_c2_g1_i1.p1 TRINITY_DN26820_c2_g1~~TRINITY_DN26820_c2_g1_i1.p1  ORF type:complete len:1392 (-),score=327.66 TRINITY_DN26820_c2_g1_i1:11-4186(-)
MASEVRPPPLSPSLVPQSPVQGPSGSRAAGFRRSLVNIEELGAKVAAEEEEWERNHSDTALLNAEGSAPEHEPQIFQARHFGRCSDLEAHRSEAEPQLPPALRALSAVDAAGIASARFELDPRDSAEAPKSSAAATFSHIGSSGVHRLVVGQPPAKPEVMTPRQALRIGVAVVSVTAPPSGTHNAILGLRRFLDRSGIRTTELVGIRSFSKGNTLELDWNLIRKFLNQGGSDMLPSIPVLRANDRFIAQVSKLCASLQLDSLVCIGGTGDVAPISLLADALARSGSSTKVTQVLASASGFMNLLPWMPTTLGFDSASCVMAEITGNISLNHLTPKRDTYHFICCGSPQLTLEVAMQTHPMLCFISDDIAGRGLTLKQVLDEICDVIVTRHHEYGLHTGVVLISDDFFASLSDMKDLIDEFDRLRREQPANILTHESVTQLLPPTLVESFTSLPSDNRHQLVFRASLDGKPLLKVSEEERELGILVGREIARRLEAGQRSVSGFTSTSHSLRHLAISPLPTPLDCELGYVLGHVAGLLAMHGMHGFVPGVSNVIAPCADWEISAVPLARLLEVRKALVDAPTAATSPTGAAAAAEAARKSALTGDTLALAFKKHRLKEGDVLFDLWRRAQVGWRFRQSCRQPGPVQYWGPGGRRDPSWATYTLRAAAAANGKDAGMLEVLAREAGIGEAFEATAPLFEVQTSGGVRRSHPRAEALLSPLQRWRVAYQPQLPKVLREHSFRMVEAVHRYTSSVCADRGLLRRVFPNLSREDHLKPLVFEHFDPDDEIWTLELPERGPEITRSEYSVASLSEHDHSSNQNLCGLGAESPLDDYSPQNLTCSPRGVTMRIGIAVMGRAGPGVFNVIQGLFDYALRSGGTVLCVPMGIAGLVACSAFEVTRELLTPFLNQGGCNLMGQSEPEDLESSAADPSGRFSNAACAKAVQELNLDGLVIWGGTKAQTWTAALSEHFLECGVTTSVIGVPASVQSDMPLVEQTLGYDSMTKVLASVLGNLSTYAASLGKTWLFVRIAGRSISHITAEISLAVHPHVVLSSSTSVWTGLMEVTEMICDVIESRHREGKNYGLVLIPDQMLGSIREVRQLIEELAQIQQLAPHKLAVRSTCVSHRDLGSLLSLLSPLSRSLMQNFPERIREQLCDLFEKPAGQGPGSPRARRGDVVKPDVDSLDFSTIETEVIFQKLVEAELTRRVVLKTYRGPFHSMTFSLNVMGRAAIPSNFDCDLGYTMGYAAGALAHNKRTGLLVDISRLKDEVEKWEVGGTPLPSFVTVKEPTDGKDDGKLKFRIEPRARILYDMHFDSVMPGPVDRTVLSPGPVQFMGPCASIHTRSLCMPQLQRVRQMERMEILIAELKQRAGAGCPPEVLRAVKTLLQGGATLLRN